MPRRRATTVRVVLAGNQMRGKESDSGVAWACPIRPSPPARGPPHALPLTHASDHPAACSTEPCARLPLYSWSAAACRGRQAGSCARRRRADADAEGRRKRRRGHRPAARAYCMAPPMGWVRAADPDAGPVTAVGVGAPHRVTAVGGWIPDLGLAACPVTPSSFCSPCSESTICMPQ